MDRKRELQAYMTLEAALLMPLVWFTMFFAVFSGFFQYDRCIAEQDSKIALLRASNIKEKSEGEIREEVLGRGELLGKNKLLFGSLSQKELSITGKQIGIKITGSIKTILQSLVKDSGIGAFSYGSAYETDRYDPIGFIRTCRRLSEYAGS